MDTINAIVRHRRGSTAAWASANPILFAGQMGYVSAGDDYGKVKIGDGVTRWNNLPFAMDGDAVRLRGDQTIEGTKTFQTSPVVPEKNTPAGNNPRSIATEAQVWELEPKINFYVSPDGVDSPERGLSAEKPFKTIQFAIDVIKTNILNTEVVAINLADGEYVELIDIKNQGILLSIIGNLIDPSRVKIGGYGGDENRLVYDIDGLSTGTSYGTFAIENSSVLIKGVSVLSRKSAISRTFRTRFRSVLFLYNNYYYLSNEDSTTVIDAAENSIIYIEGSLSKVISDNALITDIVRSSYGGLVDLRCDLHIEGDLTCTNGIAFVYKGGRLVVGNKQTQTGVITGPRFRVDEGGIISCNNLLHETTIMTGDWRYGDSTVSDPVELSLAITGAPEFLIRRTRGNFIFPSRRWTNSSAYTNGQVLGTMPSRWRPAVATVVPVIYGTTHGQLTIGTNGNITCNQAIPNNSNITVFATEIFLPGR